MGNLWGFGLRVTGCRLQVMNYEGCLLFRLLDEAATRQAIPGILFFLINILINIL